MTQLVRVLSVFDKKTEHLVKDIALEVTIEKLRDIFEIGSDASEDNYEMLYAYPVSNKEAIKLQKYIVEPIEIDKYDYFLDSYEE